MTSQSALNQINTIDSIEIVIATLNRPVNERKLSDSEISKRSKTISKLTILKNVIKMDDDTLQNVKSTFDLPFKNVTLYFFDNVDKHNIDCIAVPLSKFKIDLITDHQKNMLYVDDITLFKSLSKFDLHYLSYVFNYGFVFNVSNMSDASRIQKELKQFNMVNLTQYVAEAKSLFKKKQNKKQLEVSKFLSFFDNYGNTYNKYFLNMLTSINDIQIFEPLLSNHEDELYTCKLVFELNSYRKRYLDDKVKFISTFILPVLNLNYSFDNKTYEVSNIFGFNKVINEYFLNRKTFDLIDQINDDGMKLIMQVITSIFHEIIKTKKIVKMPRQCYPILLIWYKYVKSTMLQQLTNFMKVVYNVEKSLTSMLDETAVVYIFNVNGVDQMKQSHQKIIDIKAYNKFVDNKGFVFDDIDKENFCLCNVSVSRIENKKFERDYTEQELNKVFGLQSTTTTINDSIVLNEKCPTVNSKSDSSDDEHEIVKNVTSLTVDSDSESSDSDNLIFSYLKSKNKKYSKKSKSSSSSRSSVSSGKISVKKTVTNDLDSELDENEENEKPSDLSTTVSDAEEEDKKTSKVSSENVNLSELQNFVNQADTSSDDDSGDEHLKEKELTIKGNVLHDGSCFYGSIAFHLGIKPQEIMNELKDKLSDKDFINQVDSILEENDCISRLTGNVDIVMKTLIPNADGTYPYAENLCFAAVCVLLQKNVVVIVNDDMFLDKTGKFGDMLYVKGDGILVFDPVDDVSITKYNMKNWDGMSINLDNDDSDSEEEDEDDTSSDHNNDEQNRKTEETKDVKNIEDSSDSNVTTNDTEDKNEIFPEVTLDDDSDIETNIDEDTVDASIVKLPEEVLQKENDDVTDSDDESEYDISLEAAESIRQNELLQCQTSEQIRTGIEVIESVTKLNEDNKKLADELCNLEKQLEDTLSVLNEKETQMKEVQQSYDRMRETIKQLQDKIDDISREKNNLIIDFEAEKQKLVDAHEKEKSSMRLEYESTFSKNQQLEYNNKELSETINCKQQVIDKLQKDLKEKEAVIHRRDERIANKDNFIARLTEEKQQITIDASNLKVELENEKKKNDILNNSKLLLEEKVVKIEDDHVQLKTKLEHIMTEKEKLETKLEESLQNNTIIQDLKNQLKARDDKIAEVEAEKSKLSGLYKNTQLENIKLREDKPIAKSKYQKPEEIKSYDLYEGANFNYIMGQVKLYLQKERKEISIGKYYRLMDSQLIFGSNVDENCTIYYANHLPDIDVMEMEKNFVIVKKRCPCKGHRLITDWLSDGYVLKRNNLILNTSHVCGCMVKPASVEDLIMFGNTYPHYFQAVVDMLENF